MCVCLGDEGGDGAEAVGEDDGADDGDEDGEHALQVRDRQDVPVPHRAAHDAEHETLHRLQMEKLAVLGPE